MSNRPPNAPPPTSLEGYHLPGERQAKTQAQQAQAQQPAQSRPGPSLSIGGAARSGGGSGSGHGGGPGGGGPRAPKGAPAPRGGSWFGSFLFYLGLAVVAALVFAGAFIWGSSPDALIRARIVEAVKTHTGRDLTIEGGTSFTVYPSLGVVMRNVTLSPPPGMAGEPTARIGSLEANVRLMALLQRQIEVERLVVRDGVFDLRVDKTGRRSWQFAEAGGLAGPVRYAEVKPAGTANDASRALPSEAKDFLKNAGDERAKGAGAVPADNGLGKLRDFSLGDVRLENGTITYTDERTAKSQRISALNAAISVKSFESTLETKGNLVVEDERVDFDGRLTSLKVLLSEQPAKLVFNAAAEPVKASFDGTVHVKDVVDLNGAFALAAPSARELGAWAGTELPASEGFGPLAIKGNLHAAGKSLGFTDARFDLDGANAVGTLSVDSSAARPLIKANLKLSALDLNKYMADGPAAAPRKKAQVPAAATTKTAGAPAAQAQPPVALPKSIEDLLEQHVPAGAKGPVVKGYEKRVGWSEDPIKLASLGLADVEAALIIGSIAVRDIKIGQSRLKISLQAKHLKTTIEDMALYEGHARGLITVDAGKTPAQITASLAAENLAANPLLKDAAAIDWLSGTAKLQLAVAGSGSNEKQIVDSLDGTAGFSFANGAVAGFNVPQMLRGVSQGKLGGFERVPTEKTDFSELTANFTIKDGVADNQDLKMASPLLRVGGGGQIMLGARQIDYTAKPKVVGTLAGQGGGLNLTGLEVPVRIHGSWDAPAYTPDLQGALKSSTVQEIIKDPSKAVDAVKEVGKQLGGKKAGDLLKGLFGGN